MIRRLGILILKAPIHVYRYAISPMLAANCRFQPTCSAYALQALETHGPIRGTLLTLRRFSRCHPGGGSGHDPVPERDTRPESGEIP